VYFSLFSLFCKERQGYDIMYVSAHCQIFEAVDFHEAWYEHHATRGNPIFVFFIFYPQQ
jgi:hypothetical protein